MFTIKVISIKRETIERIHIEMDAIGQGPVSGKLAELECLQSFTHTVDSPDSQYVAAGSAGKKMTDRISEIQ